MDNTVSAALSDLLRRIWTNVLICRASSHGDEHLNCRSQRCVIVCLFFMQHSWLSSPPCLICSTQPRPGADREAFSVKSCGILKFRPPRNEKKKKSKIKKAQLKWNIWLLLNIFYCKCFVKLFFFKFCCCWSLTQLHNGTKCRAHKPTVAHCRCSGVAE